MHVMMVCSRRHIYNCLVTAPDFMTWLLLDQNLSNCDVTRQKYARVFWTDGFAFCPVLFCCDSVNIYLNPPPLAAYSVQNCKCIVAIYSFRVFLL